MTDTDTSPEAVEKPKYLIKKRGVFYRPNSEGYTTSAILAGRYTLADAVAITHPNGHDGPRDGMIYIHEDDITDEDWIAYTALSAQLAEVTDEWEKEVALRIVAEARAEAAEAKLAKAGEFSKLADYNLTNLQPKIANGLVHKDWIPVFDEYIDPVIEAARTTLAAITDG